MFQCPICSRDIPDNEWMIHIQQCRQIAETMPAPLLRPRPTQSSRESRGGSRRERREHGHVSRERPTDPRDSLPSSPARSERSLGSEQSHSSRSSRRHRERSRPEASQYYSSSTLVPPVSSSSYIPSANTTPIASNSYSDDMRLERYERENHALFLENQRLRQRLDTELLQLREQQNADWDAQERLHAEQLHSLRVTNQAQEHSIRSLEVELEGVRQEARDNAVAFQDLQSHIDTQISQGVSTSERLLQQSESRYKEDMQRMREENAMLTALGESRTREAVAMVTRRFELEIQNREDRLRDMQHMLDQQCSASEAAAQKARAEAQYQYEALSRQLHTTQRNWEESEKKANLERSERDQRDVERRQEMECMVTELQRRLESVQGESNERGAQLRQVQAELEQSRAAYDALRNERDKEQGQWQVQLLTLQATTEQSMLAREDRVRAEVYDELCRAKDTINALHVRVGRMQKQETAVEALQQELATVRETLALREEQIQQRAQEWMDIRNEHEKQCSSMQETQRELGELGIECSMLRAQTQEQQYQLERMSQELAEKTQKARDLETRLGACTQERDHLQLQTSVHRQQQSDWELRAVEWERGMEAMQKDAKRMTLERDRLQKELERAQSERIDAVDRWERLQNDHAALQESFAKWQASYNEKDHRAEVLKEASRQLQQMVRQRTTTLEAHRAKVAELDAALLEAQDARAWIESQWTDLETHASQLGTQLDAAQEAVMQHRATEERMQIALNHATTELAELRTQYDCKETAYADLVQVRDVLHTAYETLETKYAELMEDHVAHQSQVAEEKEARRVEQKVYREEMAKIVSSLSETTRVSKEREAMIQELQSLLVQTEEARKGAEGEFARMELELTSWQEAHRVLQEKLDATLLTMSRMEREWNGMREEKEQLGQALEDAKYHAQERIAWEADHIRLPIVEAALAHVERQRDALSQEIDTLRKEAMNHGLRQGELSALTRENEVLTSLLRDCREDLHRALEELSTREQNLQSQWSEEERVRRNQEKEQQSWWTKELEALRVQHRVETDHWRHTERTQQEQIRGLEMECVRQKERVAHLLREKESIATTMDHVVRQWELQQPLSSETQSLTQQLQQLVEQLQRIEREKQQLEATNRAHAERLDHYDTLVANFESWYQEPLSEASIRALREGYTQQSELRHALQHATIQWETLEAGLRAKELELTTLRKEHTTLMSDMDALRVWRSKIVSELQDTHTLQQRIRELGMELEASQGRVREMEQSIASNEPIRMERDALRVQYTDLLADLRCVQKERNDALEEISKGVRQRDALQNRLEQVQAQIQGMQMDATHWAKRVEQLETQLTAAQADRAWEVTEAIPVHPQYIAMEQQCRELQQRVVEVEESERIYKETTLSLQQANESLFQDRAAGLIAQEQLTIALRDLERMKALQSEWVAHEERAMEASKEWNVQLDRLLVERRELETRYQEMEVREREAQQQMDAEIQATVELRLEHQKLAHEYHKLLEEREELRQKIQSIEDQPAVYARKMSKLRDDTIQTTRDLLQKLRLAEEAIRERERVVSDLQTQIERMEAAARLRENLDVDTLRSRVEELEAWMSRYGPSLPDICN